MENTIEAKLNKQFKKIATATSLRIHKGDCADPECKKCMILQTKLDSIEE